MKKQKELSISIFENIPDDLHDAKHDIQNQYISQIEQESDKVMIMSAKKKYTSTPTQNIMGIGIGEKYSDGQFTGELCIKVLVAKKYPKSQISRKNLISPRINGIATDIEGVGYINKLSSRHRTKVRPVQPGVSVSPLLSQTNAHMAGTFGVLAHARTNKNKLFIISNNHVLANENDIDIGADIIQPGTLDGGRNSDHVATLSHVVPLKFENKRNWMDAAAAQLKVNSNSNGTIMGIGEPRSGGKAKINSLVRKSGRTTGVTEGIVRIMALDLFNVGYTNGMVRIDHIFAVQGINGDFSRAGDSGSAVIDARGRVVGLLFAGGGGYSYIIPIGRILRRFKMRI